jgi:hypothetical protein
VNDQETEEISPMLQSGSKEEEKELYRKLSIKDQHCSAILDAPIYLLTFSFKIMSRLPLVFLFRPWSGMA